MLDTLRVVVAAEPQCMMYCSLFLLSDFLDTHIYLTRGWQDSQAFAIMLQEGDDRDAITGLQTKTHFGRPDWNKEFDSISQAHPK